MRVPVAAAVVLCLAGCCLYHAPRIEAPPPPVPGPKPPVSSGEPLVRVRLAAGKTAYLSSDGGLVLAAGSRRQSVGSNRKVEVALERGQIVVTGGPAAPLSVDTLSVTADKDGLVRVGDRSYRGRLLLFPSTDGDLAVVNVLGIEDYLLGVVPCEIGR